MWHHGCLCLYRRLPGLFLHAHSVHLIAVLFSALSTAFSSREFPRVVAERRVISLARCSRVRHPTRA